MPESSLPTESSPVQSIISDSDEAELELDSSLLDSTDSPLMHPWLPTGDHPKHPAHGASLDVPTREISAQ